MAVVVCGIWGRDDCGPEVDALFIWQAEAGTGGKHVDHYLGGVFDLYANFAILLRNDVSHIICSEFVDFTDGRSGDGIDVFVWNVASHGRAGGVDFKIPHLRSRVSGCTKECSN